MVMRIIWTILAIFIAWTILDFFLHEFFLRSVYESTPNLWRPMSQMSAALICLVRAVLILCFMLIYALLIKEKSFASGIQFGALFGLAIGVSVGFGTYIHTPMPLTLAWGWFLGGWIKAIAAGAIAGTLVK
jgi:hypothetical protein